MRNAGGHGNQVSGSQAARLFTFGEKQQFPIRDVSHLFVRMRMVGIGRGPGSIVDIEDHGHQLAGMQDAPLEARAKPFAPGLVEGEYGSF